MEERYSRNILLKEIGVEGQKKLLSTKVLVVGAGGLGSPILLYLASSGIGEIGIIDDDVVSLTNLQRQVLYDYSQIGLAKVDMAKQRLEAINPNIKINTYNIRLMEDNAEGIISVYDIVVGATDNLASRHIIDKYCYKLSIPMIHGAIREFEGQVSVFNYKGGPRYENLFPSHTDNYSQPLGVIGPIAGVVGSIQALEAIKVALGRDDTLSGILLLVDLLAHSFVKLKIAIN